jgi:hypothetical protein
MPLRLDTLILGMAGPVFRAVTTFPWLSKARATYRETGTKGSDRADRYGNRCSLGVLDRIRSWRSRFPWLLVPCLFAIATGVQVAFGHRWSRLLLASGFQFEPPCATPVWISLTRVPYDVWRYGPAALVAALCISWHLQ